MSDGIAREDMPESVLDGRLGELYHSRLQRFPIAYAWGALVTVAGSLIPRSASPLRTNLYWCATGPKGTGKSQSHESTLRLLGMWPSHPILLQAKFGSAEGLIDRLQDVEPNAGRLVSVDELGHLMSKAAIDRSSFPFVLNTAYYQDIQNGGTKGHQFQLDCRISIVGGLVEELFGDSFGMATTGGLHDRFIFGLCPEPYEYLYRPFDGPVEKLYPFIAEVDSEIWDARDEWVKVEGIAPRVAEHALRVAYICACVDGRPTLRTADLGPALEFARYQMRVRKVLQPNPGENADAKCAIAIRSWLTEHADGGRWVRQRDLDRGINSSRSGPGVFTRCLQNLQFADEIEVDRKRKMVRLLMTTPMTPEDNPPAASVITARARCVE